MNNCKSQSLILKAETGLNLKYPIHSGILITYTMVKIIRNYKKTLFDNTKISEEYISDFLLHRNF